MAEGERKYRYHWKDPGPLARWTYAGIATAAVMGLFGVTLEVYFADQIDPPDGEAPLTAFTALYDLISMLEMLAYIPGLMWLWRVGANANSTGAQLRYGPWAAVWWNFVPIAHFFMPFIVLGALFRESGVRRPPSLIAYWAASVLSFSVAYAFVAYVLIVISRGGETAASPWLLWTMSAIEAPVYPALAWMVWSLTRLQQRRVELARVFSDAAAPA